MENKRNEVEGSIVCKKLPQTTQIEMSNGEKISTLSIAFFKNFESITFIFEPLEGERESITEFVYAFQ